MIEVRKIKMIARSQTNNPRGSAVVCVFLRNISLRRYFSVGSINLFLSVNSKSYRIPFHIQHNNPWLDVFAYQNVTPTKILIENKRWSGEKETSV